MVGALGEVKSFKNLGLKVGRTRLHLDYPKQQRQHFFCPLRVISIKKNN